MPDLDAAHLIASLINRHYTVATCESLTGGLIGAALTSVPGSSATFRGGLITYASDLKVSLARVDADVIWRSGVVSEQAAVQMAMGAARACGADLAVAVTGVAGPDPQEGHPPGEVWLAVAGPGKVVVTTRVAFLGDRDQIRQHVVQTALSLLEDTLGQLALSTAADRCSKVPASE